MFSIWLFCLGIPYDAEAVANGSIFNMVYLKVYKGEKKYFFTAYEWPERGIFGDKFHISRALLVEHFPFVVEELEHKLANPSKRDEGRPLRYKLGYGATNDEDNQCFLRVMDAMVGYYTQHVSPADPAAYADVNNQLVGIERMRYILNTYYPQLTMQKNFIPDSLAELKTDMCFQGTHGDTCLYLIGYTTVYGAKHVCVCDTGRKAVVTSDQKLLQYDSVSCMFDDSKLLDAIFFYGLEFARKIKIQETTKRKAKEGEKQRNKRTKSQSRTPHG